MSRPATPVTVHAPGSLMLMGEHAVLHSHHALCAAVEDSVKITLSPGEQGRYEIESSLGSASGSLREVNIVPELRFVLTALDLIGAQKGVRMEIESGIDSTMGFGSSAAVTVATVGALRAWNGEVFDRSAIFRAALEVIRSVQGRGSGADVAASTYGGVVLYRANPLFLEPIRRHLPLVTVYCGYKTPTPQVIEIVEQHRTRHPDLHEALYRTMNESVLQAAPALRDGDLETLGALFNLHNGLQAAIGTEDATLARLVHRLRELPGVWGSKISGSGLGDCVIALGREDAAVDGFFSRPVTLDVEGVSLNREVS